MASSSSTTQVINLGTPPSNKLTRANYSLWQPQVLPSIRGARLVGLLDGTEAKPPMMLVVAAEKSAEDGGDADKAKKTIPKSRV